MSVWFCLILASLLSCAGQLCQKQATRPSRSGRRGRHILAVAGLSPVGARRRMLLWLGVAAGDPGRYRLSDAEPQLCLGNAGGMGLSGASRWRAATGLASG